MSYFENRLRYKFLLVLSIATLAFTMFASSTIGIADISIIEAIRIIASKIPGLNLFVNTNNIENTHVMIILKIRMPRILLAASVGAILSIVGGCFQGMFRNPMADPYVLGISNGAGLGATIAIVFGLERYFFGLGVISSLAFVGAFSTIIAVYLIARVGGRLHSVNLLLSGIAVGLFESAIITILMILNRDKIENIIFWMMGSVATASWGQVATLVPACVLGAFVLFLFSRDLNVISTGEDTAKSLGVRVEFVKKLLLFVCSLLIAICVSVSGIIGFVGLVVPHAVRLLIGPDHRNLLPFSAIGGALFLVICDTLARTLMSPVELPVGAVTSLFGAPYFIYLIIKAKKKVAL